MRQILTAIAAALLLFLTYYYFIGGYGAATRVYKRYVNMLFKRIEGADKYIANASVAESSYNVAKNFYESNYAQFRELPNYPLNDITEMGVSEDGKEVWLLMRQVVPREQPSIFSPVKIKFLAYLHNARLLREGLVWKVEQHRFSTTDFLRKENGDPLREDHTISFVDDLVLYFKNLLKLSGKGDSSLKGKSKISVQEILEKAETETPENPDMKTFYLESGETIKGKIVREDDVYYSVEGRSGTEEIVIKEDIVKIV
ncbi:MAG: hypothetical protein JW893_05480 [Candidatus Omnitrophica bacterium]|nr:hypothetical protein [Candidatus Omnitrophota bacterium]